MSQRHFSLVSWTFVIAMVLVGGMISAVQAQSIEDIEAKVKEMPEDPARHYNLGVAYYKGKKYTDAITAFQEAIKLKEGYKEAYYNMGLAQQKVGKNSASIKSLKKAVEFDPNYADAHAALGNSYRKNGQHSAAARAYKAALKIKPNNADWHYNLGIVYQMQDDLESALTAYQAFLEYTPKKNSKRARQIKDIVQQIEEALQ